MLPTASRLAWFSFSFDSLCHVSTCPHDLFPQLVAVSAARSDPPKPQARAAGRATRRRGQERAARAKEKKLRRQERLEQYNKEYRLREQQGLSPPPALAISSSNEEEKSDGEQTTSDRWKPVPPSPRAEGATEELVPGAGADPPAARILEEAPAGATEALACAEEVPPQPSRKKKW
jgi:hypothetical protein